MKVYNHDMKRIFKFLAGYLVIIFIVTVILYYAGKI